MDMIALNKTTRGVSLYREDILKYRELVKGKNLNEFIRELFHAEMAKHKLTKSLKEKLDREMDDALRHRESRHPGYKPRKAKGGDRKAKRVLCIDPITLKPNPKFVKAR